MTSMGQVKIYPQVKKIKVLSDDAPRKKKKRKFSLGPLHMSLVTGLAQLPGQILLSVHMRNLSLVERDEIQETKPKWCHINMYCSGLS